MEISPQLPPPVVRGDRIGIAALSGPVKRQRLRAGIEGVEALGLVPVLASNLESRAGLFAGSDDERVAGLCELARDPEVKAILFARGGHGILRLLDRIDWELLGQTPRAYVGYSDLTPFLDQVVRRLGLIAFHGPMVAGDLARGLDNEEADSLLRALSGDLGLELQVDALAGSEAAEGRLAGGCLSLVAATLGTPHAPSLSGTILFWEDVHEPVYRLDRMLTQLRLAGVLGAIRGMVVGRVETREADASLREVLAEHAEALGVPVVLGCPSGHCRPNLTLPLGAWARLDPERGTLLCRERPAES